MRRISFLILILLMSACSEKIPFTVQTKKETFVTPGVQKFSSHLCGNQTVHKPKVDILFVVDNSTSLNPAYASNELKQSMSNIITHVSDNFDYHAFIVPLIDYSGAEEQLVVSDATSLGIGAPTPKGLSDVDVQQYLSNTQPGGSELGLARVRDAITGNISNGVFRKEVHTLVVMISNGDDTDNIVDPYGNTVGTHYSTRLQELKNLTKASGSTTLEALTLRFFSVVAHSACKNGFIKGTRYMQMSKDLYNYSGATDQGSNPNPDSYNLCSNSISNIFTSIAAVLPTTVVNHVYNYWPAKVTNNTQIDFNENAIVVKRVNSNGTIETLNEDPTNGWQFLTNHQVNLNIREYPTVSTEYPAERLTGFFVQLHGNAKVTSPACLVVQIQDPQEYFGYIAIENNPDLNDTIIKKNGVIVNQSNTDGWQFLYFSPNKNIRIMGPNDHTDHPDKVYRTGYFFKMNGSAVYTNEDIITVEYKQTGVE